MASTSEINARVEQFITDLDKAHLIVHGGVGVSVATDGGLVRSFASVINQLDADVEAAADSVIAQVLGARDQAVNAGASASGSATTATNAATAALGYRDQAQTYANAASGSATTATTQAGLASGSATTANTKAGEALASANAAAQSASVSVNSPGTSATSSTSLTVGTGSKAITLSQTGKAFLVGQWAYLADSSAPSVRWMHGTITAFNSSTGAMTVNVVRSFGTGTVSTWLVMPATPNYDTISADSSGNVTFTGGVNLGPSVGGIANSNSSQAKTSVLSAGASTDAAFMSFHRPGFYAAYFGLDVDNKWKVGGWSMGGVAYEVLHTGNFNPATYAAVASPTLSGIVQIQSATASYGMLNLIGTTAGQEVSINYRDTGQVVDQGWTVGKYGTSAFFWYTGGAQRMQLTSGGDLYVQGGIRVGASGNPMSGGNLVWHAGSFNPANYAPLAGAAFTGAVSVAGSVAASGAGGFISTNFVPNTRNPIWRFGDSPGYGLSYFQGTSGYGGFTDSVGVHFGTATSAGSQFLFNANGDFRASGAIFAAGAIYAANGNAVWHAGNFNPGNYFLQSGGTITGGISVTGGYLQITQAGGAQRLLIGNQDSGGTNKPSMIVGANGALEFGFGNSWTGSGGTFTSYAAFSSVAANFTTPLQQNGNQVWHAGNSNFAFGSGGTSAYNFDTVKSPGLYHYDGGIGGTSPDGEANYRVLEMGASSRYTQVAFPWISDNMYFRRRQDSSWGAWRKVWHDGNFVPANYLPLIGGSLTGSLSSNGAISAARVFAGYDSSLAGSVNASNWFRSNGATGWTNDTYGGSWYMSDTSYLRVGGGKGVSVGVGVEDPYGAVGVTRTADGNAYCYFGMTRAGQQTWGFGINSSNAMVIGSGATGLNGTINALASLTTSGTFTASNIAQTSDERLKSDWLDLPEDFVERLAGLKIGTYAHKSMTGRHAGASAQSMRGILPEVVLEMGKDDEDEDAMLTITYGPAALVSAAMLARRVVELERRLNAAGLQ